jgi:hypothetical protein
MRKRQHRQETGDRMARLGVVSEVWLRAAFAPPRAPSELARSIMEQLDLRLQAKRPALPLDRLGLAASPTGITRVFLRRGGIAPSAAAEGGRTGKLIAQARKELAEFRRQNPFDAVL